MLLPVNRPNANRLERTPLCANKMTAWNSNYMSLFTWVEFWVKISPKRLFIPKKFRTKTISEQKSFCTWLQKRDGSKKVQVQKICFTKNLNQTNLSSRKFRFKQISHPKEFWNQKILFAKNLFAKKCSQKNVLIP